MCRTLSGQEPPFLSATGDLAGSTTKLGYLRTKLVHTEVAMLIGYGKSRLQESTSAGRIRTVLSIKGLLCWNVCVCVCV